MRRLDASIQILKSSWAVLRKDKELAVIPVVSFLATVSVMAVVGTGLWFTLDTDRVVSNTVDQYSGSSSDTSLAATPLTYVIGFLGYLLVTFVVTYFAAVLVAGAFQRLTGGNPTLASALVAANKRLPAIIGWSVLAGTVGFVLRMFEERAGFLGALVVRLIGAAWQIVTWLAVPVIVMENTGPVDSLKRSAALFRQTWGENLIAQAGFGIISLLVMIPTAVIIALVMPLAPVIAIALAVVVIGTFSVLLSTLNGIFRAALYLYATTGQAPSGFAQESLAAAFGARR